MDESTHLHHPGEKVPVSGIYKCSCGEEHRFANVDVLGHTFPPVPRDCSGIGWHLLTPAHAERSP